MGKVPPTAEKGILDLKDWDFEKDGNINLDGEWEFYWKEFPVGDELALPEDKKNYLEVPRVWNGMIIRRKTVTGESDNETLEGEGYATYRLRILNIHNGTLAIRLPDQGSSYQIYINKILFQESGKVGYSFESSRADRIIQYSLMKSEREELEILIKISNFHIPWGGFWGSLKLGNPDLIFKLRDSNLAS